MPAPAIATVVRLIASKGSREAIKKYGTKIVNKAKKLMKGKDKPRKPNTQALYDRDRARRAREIARSEGRTGTANSPRQTAVREGRMGADTARRYSRARAQSEGRVGKFRDGGEVTSVRGAGKAVRGVRPAKIH